MFKYQIHKLSKGGKDARDVKLEDILTSDVFGLMTYFPYEVLLKTFLDQIRLKNIKSSFSVPVTAPIDVNFWKSYNWPEHVPYIHRESIEQDVVIEWDDILLIVEAKFRSRTEPEELLREYLVGANEAGSGKRFYLLLIDKNLSAPTISISNSYDKISVSKYIENRIRNLKISHLFPTEKIHSAVLWTNWQSFYVVVERLIQQGKYKNWQILKDLLLILARKDLIPFEPLTLKDFKKWKIDLNSLGEIGFMLRSSFSDLSDITIDLDYLGNIGLKLNDAAPFLSGI